MRFFCKVGSFSNNVGKGHNSRNSKIWKHFNSTDIKIKDIKVKEC